MNVFRRGHGRDQVERLANKFPHLHGLGRDGDAPRFDAGDVQDLVDQFEEVPPGFEDLLHALRLLRPQRVHLQQLGEPQDRVQRRA